MAKIAVTTVPSLVALPPGGVPILYNNGTVIVYIGDRSTVTAANGFPLKPGERAVGQRPGGEVWLVTGTSDPGDIRYLDATEVVPVSAHRGEQGEPGTPSTLADLTDTAFTTPPTQGEALVYDSLYWTPKALTLASVGVTQAAAEVVAAVTSAQSVATPSATTAQYNAVQADVVALRATVHSLVVKLTTAGILHA
jgi:hypothetical protein